MQELRTIVDIVDSVTVIVVGSDVQEVFVRGVVVHMTEHNSAIG